MGVGLFIGLIIIVILIVLIVIIFFPKRNRTRLKRWRITGTVLLAVVLTPILILLFESYFYFKSDVLSDLKKLNISLQDNFEIEDNETVGLIDFYRTTTVTISKNDNERISKMILESTNLREISLGDFNSNGVKWTDKPDSIYNYRFTNEFTKELIREMFERKDGYAAISTSVTISEKDNKLIIRVVD